MRWQPVFISLVLISQVATIILCISNILSYQLTLTLSFLLPAIMVFGYVVDMWSQKP